MKLITDNAFSKAWEVNCSSCKKDKPNSILWFRKKCNDCVAKDMADKKYTDEDMLKCWNTAWNDAISIDFPTYKPTLYEDFINSLK